MLQLQEKEKLDLDEPVSKYLPRFRMKDGRYGQITVRMLLNHSAELPGTNYDRVFATQPDPEYVHRTLAALQDSELKSDPGDTNVYCNDCFTVAQAVIERVTHMRFADYIKSAIFVPAGMSNSSYNFKQGDQNIATIYSADLQSGILPPEYVNGHGTGGITTTAVDLCLFSQALDDGKLLKPGSIKELGERQPGLLGAGPSLASVGLGWDAVSVPEFAAKGITMLSKDGITTFFRSQLFVAPKEHLAVAAILAGPADLPVSAVIDLATKVAWAALEDKSVVWRTTSTPATSSEPHAIPEKLYQFEGIYGGSAHAIYHFTFDKAANTLNIAKFVNDGFVHQSSAKYIGDGRFDLPGVGIISFAIAQDGRKLSRHDLDDKGGVEVLAESINPDGSAETEASEFPDTTWVPRNLSADDYSGYIYSGLYKTGSVKALPGIIYLRSGTDDYAAYGLSDRYTGKMILPYESDQVDIKILHKDGERILKAGTFQFIDAKAVLPIRHSEEITIGSDGQNVARKFLSGISFASTIPAGGRILIYSPDGSTQFDSQIMSNRTVEVKPDSFVVFIGKAGAIFQTE
jgi:CubicO group peptidase (beta-lactamase class C family)